MYWLQNPAFSEGCLFFGSIRQSLWKISFHFWWLVVSCKWRQLLYLIMCYDFRGSMNLLFFLCNVQNFILGLRINHNFILRIWPEEDIGKKYIIRNEQIILQNTQPKIERMSLILWNIQRCKSYKKGELHFISKLANDKGIVA